jgi:uncharacterized protein
MQDSLATAAGIIVGFVLGLLGGGGSIIAVPLLIYGVGISSPHMAIGTSAGVVSRSALANLVNHARQGAVKWPCAITFALSGIAGTWAGSSLALRVPGQNLLGLFGLLMIIVGALMLMRKNAEGDPDVRLNLKTARNMLPWLVSSGLAVGTLSGLFGIGGGFLIVPALMLATGMPIRNAIATSLVAITVFGASSAAAYAWHGEVDWRLAAFFVVGGVLGGLAGTWSGTKLATHKSTLNFIFALFVIATGCYVLVRSIPALMGTS